MSLFDQMVVYGMPLIPKFIVGKVARRYVAGERREDALRAVRELMEEGAMATIDVLGEEVSERAKAEAAVEEYLRLYEMIEIEGLDANVSVKPTLLGLKIDEDFCSSNIERIVELSHSKNNFVRIDMEDCTTTTATLGIYRKMLERFGTEHVGVVLQAYMRRTVPDISDLLDLRPNIRLCKGIYRESRAVAWKDFDTIRSNFIYALKKLLRGGAYVGIATHDPHLVWAGMAAVDELGLEPDAYEFQMLYGVDPPLRRLILDAGHRLRVYVPYGRDWYPYSTRRLRENPTVARHVVKAMLGIGRR